MTRAALVMVISLGACGGGTSAIIPAALDARYDAEQPVVFQAAHDEAHGFGILAEDPIAGTIKTEWERVKVRRPGKPVPETFRIQYDIAVVGPRPFKINVVGNLAVDEGQAPIVDPSDFTGERVQRLRSAIYRRLDKVAVR